MNDNDHAIALQILETLLNFNGALSLEELSSTLRNSSETSNLVSVDNLRFFLKNYPSLFCVQDNLVIPLSCTEPVSYSTHIQPQSDSLINYGPVSISLQYLDPHYHQINPDTIDFATEQQAVRYFKFQLARRKGEQWVPIRSLSGHLSQAKPNIRNFLPTLEDFISLLKRHPDVFAISEDHVSLVEKLNGLSQKNSLTPTLPPKGPFFSGSTKNGKIRPRFKNKRKNSPLDDTRSLCSNQSYLNSSEYDKTYENTSRVEITFPDLHAPTEGCTIQVKLSIIEYCSVMLIRRLLFRVGSQGTHPGLILRRLFRAPPMIREVIGWTRIELDEFLTKHSLFFERIPSTLQINMNHDEHDEDKKFEGDYLVRVPENTVNLNVDIIQLENESKLNLSNFSANARFASTEEVTNICPPEDIISNKGIIFHVAKLWGIIDLGQHEHVFFDKSIFKNVEDLQKHFQLGEVVYFNAIAAPRRSRAKWKATRVWKEDDHVTLKSLKAFDFVSTPNNHSLKRYSSLNGDGNLAPDSTLPNLGTKSTEINGFKENGFDKNHSDVLNNNAVDLIDSHMTHYGDDEENSRFLGDQDLGLSLLSLADLKNIDYNNRIMIDHDLEETNNKKEKCQIELDAKRRPSAYQLDGEDETLDDIPNLPVENSSQATTVNTATQSTDETSQGNTISESTGSGAHQPSSTSKNIACQTVITGKLNPKFLYKGNLCSLDETFDDPSQSARMLDNAN